ncbi:hypothetical protein [Jiangella rhizosphaerae]|uniref:Ig-like domain-containing protein n=1 Tax=Jiangella rhizosphaerae TaxID=2293569 RepID=A0A418KM06_9ACTN|nr:hypothetical protein [Jiangella rhizosphaerae]RIQ18986.1 hypothetical protein DY240_20165 [Jiangella rhizosphaerae]
MRVGRPRRALGTIVASAVVTALLGVNAPSAQAIGNDPISTPPTAEFHIDATTNSNPVNLPGSDLTMNLVQGEGVWLYTRNLVARTEWPNQDPDPGATFIVQCYGPGIASTGTGWYAARNLDPPHNEFTFRPQIRAMFRAPSTGTYTCRLRVAAYQPRSGTIRVWFDAGATLHATPVKPTSSVGVTAGYGWTVPDSGTGPQPYISPASPFRRHNYGNYTFQDSGSSKVTIAMDQNVTTCTYGDGPRYPVCVGADADGTRVKFDIVVQPQHLDGSACGVSSPIRVFEYQIHVIAPYHHYPLSATAVLDKNEHLFGCPRVNIAMDLTWLSGEPMVIHTQRAHDQRPGWGGIYEHG